MVRYFSVQADEEYQDWQRTNKKIFKKINDLIDSIEEHGFLCGLGKPEQLKHFDQPMYSRKMSASVVLSFPAGFYDNL